MLNEEGVTAQLIEFRSICPVHKQAVDHPFAASRGHFLTFHDSSLEAIAGNVAVIDKFELMIDAVTEMLRIANPW